MQSELLSPRGRLCYGSGSSVARQWQEKNDVSTSKPSEAVEFVGDPFPANAPTQGARRSSDPSAREAFEVKVQVLRLDAIMGSARAREYAAEWLLAGLALAAVYVFAVVLPRGTVTFVDCVILLTTVGGGMVMLRHEWRRSWDLRRLADDLEHRRPG